MSTPRTIRRLAAAVGIVRLTAGGFTRDLPIPAAPAPPPPAQTGDYASAYRYTPRVTLPDGYVYNTATGLVDRTEAAWDVVPGQGARTIDPAAYTTVVRLQATPDVAANQAALQGAVDAALGRTTHTLILRSAGSWGYLVFRARAVGGWIVVAYDTVDPASPVRFPCRLDQRPTREQLLTCPKHEATGDGAACITYEEGSRRCAVIGADVTFAPSFDTGSHLTGYRPLFNGFITAQGGATTDAANYAKDVVLSHVGVHGVYAKASTRGMRMNTARFSLKYSCVYHIGTREPDCQAFSALSGPGPYRLHDNDLECMWGEVVMFGGDASGKDINSLCSNIAITNNTLAFNLVLYLNDQGSTKNLIEFKCGRWVLVQGNTLGPCYCRGDFAQQFFVIQTKVGNPEPWAVTQHVCFRANRVKDSYGHIGVSASDGRVSYLEFAHNVFEDRARDGVGRAWANQIDAIVGLHIHHNTQWCSSPDDFGAWVLDLAEDGVAHPGLSLQGNLVFLPSTSKYPSWFIKRHFDIGAGFWAALNGAGLVPGGGTGGNVFVHPGLTQAMMMPGDRAVTDARTLGVSATGAIAPGSPLLTADLDGGASGADLRLVPA